MKIMPSIFVKEACTFHIHIWIKFKTFSVILSFYVKSLVWWNGPESLDRIDRCVQKVKQFFPLKLLEHVYKDGQKFMYKLLDKECGYTYVGTLTAILQELITLFCCSFCIKQSWKQTYFWLVILLGKYIRKVRPIQGKNSNISSYYIYDTNNCIIGLWSNSYLYNSRR